MRCCFGVIVLFCLNVRFCKIALFWRVLVVFGGVLCGVWRSIFDGDGGELKNGTQGALPTAFTTKIFSRFGYFTFFVKVLDRYIADVIIYQ